ncbi:MAG: hypothetical protein AAF601_03765 [Pseudomonadota bacterium]
MIHHDITDISGGVVGLKTPRAFPQYTPVTFTHSGSVFRDAGSKNTKRHKRLDTIVGNAIEHLTNDATLMPIAADALVHPKTHHDHLAAFGAMPAEFSPDHPDAARFAMSPDQRLVGVIGHDLVLDDVWICDPEGRTRVFAAWHQSAARNDLDMLVTGGGDPAYGKAQQHYLPFGVEALAPEIDRCLAQQNFDAALGFRPITTLGDTLCMRTSHATMRQVAGAAPGTPSSQSTRLLLANLPELTASKAGQTHIAHCTTLAVLRMAAMADQLWTLNGCASTITPGGFDLTIHLPADLQSAPQEARDVIADLIDILNADRTARNARPISFGLQTPRAPINTDPPFPDLSDTQQKRALT